MAERIQVELVDDIDGSRANNTVTFALDGVSYEIDLNEAHSQQLRAILERYIKAARAPKPEPVRSTRQQEREEEQTRKANKQLTEQIRGAAQRTREHLSKKTTDEPGPEQTEPEQAAPVQVAEAPSPTTESVEEPLLDQSPDVDETGEDDRVPAVSLPLFSSAD